MSILTKLGDLAKGKVALSTPSRSPKWPATRSAYLKIHGVCAVCSGTKSLEVHHMRPFHLHPELELDPLNLITLCESGNNGINCHLLVGHLGNYKNANTNVAEDAAIWNLKLAARPIDPTLIE